MKHLVAHEVRGVLLRFDCFVTRLGVFETRLGVVKLVFWRLMFFLTRFGVCWRVFPRVGVLYHVLPYLLYRVIKCQLLPQVLLPRREIVQRRKGAVGEAPRGV